MARFIYGRTTGELTVYAANLSTILGTTSGAGLTYGSGWHYVEVKIVVGTAGSVEIRVDGSQRLLVTSVNTTNAAHDAYYSCINFDIATQYRIDDIYVADGSGTLHNSFLGAQTVIGLLPAADTAVEQWQPSSAVPHSSIVNSPAVVPRTDWLHSGTSGAEDLYQYAPLSGVASVAGIQINTTCRATDATAYSLKTPVLSGSTPNADAGQPVPTGVYVTVCRIIETDPATSAEWTQAGINQASFGVQVG